MDFRVLVEMDLRGGRVERRVELAENRADPDVRVLQVRCGVALQREHPVPREHVVGQAALRELGKFHRADADGFRDPRGFLALQVRVLFGDRLGGAFDGFFEHFDEPDVVAGAGFHQLAVVAEDRSEGDVFEIPSLAPARGGVEKLAEMQLLRHADDVPDVVRLPLVDAELDRRQIGGGVEKPAVGLADDRRIIRPAFLLVDLERVFFQRLAAVGENADRAVALAGDAFFQELLDQAGQAVVVVTFSQPVVELHVEPVVDFLEAVFGNLDALLPDREVLRVASLEFDQLRLAVIEHARLFLQGIDLAVNAHQLGDRIGGERGLVEEMVPAVNDHPELGAPVADVVVRDDLEAEKARDAGE